MSFKKVVSCPACGHRNDAAAARCVICGAELAGADGDGPPSKPGVRRPAPPSGRRPPARRRAPGRRRPARRPARPVRPPNSLPASARDATLAQRRGPPAPGRPARPSTRLGHGPNDADRVQAWLSCDPLPPIPLGTKPVLSIGRGESCDLCLPHRQVSRLHAVVKIRGRTIVIEDEGSANGTVHNGLPITSAELAVGDKVLIGPYELEIRHPDQLLSPNQSTTTIHNSRLLLSEAAFGGQLADFPISELLQQLEFNQKTGLLKISASDDHPEGMLVVRDGAPVMARFGGHEAEEAVLVMVTSLEDGRFSFRKEEVPGSHRLNATLTGLLLEASRRIDENVPLVADDIDVDDTEVRGISVVEVRAAAEARRAQLSAGDEAALEHSDDLLEEEEPGESPARDGEGTGGTSYLEDSTSEPQEGGMDSKAWDDFWGG